MLTDPISDMLTRLRNAGMARLESTTMPHSNVKERIAELLQAEGYVASYSVDKAFPAKLTVQLRYDRDRNSAIVGVKRRSRPGRRLYVGHEAIPRVLNGMGISIVSTSRGMMTDRIAREKRVGGELVCEVW